MELSSQIIYESEVCHPSLERATTLVPKDFRTGYAWFQEHENEQIHALPFGDNTPEGCSIPLARQSGIHIPSQTRVIYQNGKRYVLSIHTSSRGIYADRQVIHFDDGTWILEYAAHKGADTHQGYNQTLMNCLADGVPVGVMIAEKGGYRVLGLAFVERFNSATNTFTLHGPVNEKTEARQLFSVPGLEELPDNKADEIDDMPDDIRRAKVWQVRRVRQEKFRALLLEAYNGQCAATGADVPQGLQAAHINPYCGRRSQSADNGILFRADIHRLFDAHLLSVKPDDHRICLSALIEDSYYRNLLGTQLRTPRNTACAPKNEYLDTHFKQFEFENSECGIAC